MKKNLLALLLAGAVILSGCNFFDKGPEKDAAEVVQESILKLQEVRSGDYAMTFEVELNTDKEGMGFQKVSGEGSFMGVYDVKDLENPMFSMLMTLSGKRDKAKEDDSVKAEVRMAGGQMYMMLEDITDFEGNIPAIFVEPFKGQWFSMALPADVLDTALVSYKDESLLTDKEKELKNLYRTTSLLRDVKYKGTEKLDGVEVYRYSANFDNEAFQNYMKEYARLSGSGDQVLPQDEEEIKKIFDKMEFSDGYVLVGKDDMTARAMGGDLKINDLEGVNIEASFEYKVENLGGSVTVEVPKDAKEFDPLSMFGLPAGGSTLTPEELEALNEEFPPPGTEIEGTPAE